MRIASMAEWLQPGQKAPNFSLADQTGTQVSLADFRGAALVIYFYPKDNTPGCTKQACAFRDAHQCWQDLGVKVVGISPDDEQSHKKFAEKYRLNFPILADVNHRVAERFGAWREKTNFGRTSMGVQRSTFVLDPQGRVVKVWKRVVVEGHVEEVKKFVKQMLSHE